MNYSLIISRGKIIFPVLSLVSVADIDGNDTINMEDAFYWDIIYWLAKTIADTISSWDFTNGIMM